MSDQFLDLWVEPDEALDCTDPAARELLAYWESKKAGRRVPSRRDIDPVEIRDLLRNVILIDVEHCPLRLKYRLIGTGVTTAMGRDSTGKYYDEIYSRKLLSGIYRTFEWMFENWKPLRTHGEAFYPDRNFYNYEALNLPLSSDDKEIDMVFAGLYFHAFHRQ